MAEETGQLINDAEKDRSASNFLILDIALSLEQFKVQSCSLKLTSFPFTYEHR